MKNYTLLLFFVFGILCTQAQVNAETIVNEFLLPSAGGVFRGFDFTTLESKIKETELTRPLMKYAFEDVEDNLNMTLGYDLNFKNTESNFAYIDYKLDLIGVYEVIATVYLETNQMAYDVFNQLNKHYTSKLGIGVLQSDGWTKFKGKLADDACEVWIFLDEDEYGKFVRYELIYM